MKKEVDYYECPGCGYRITEEVFLLAITDLPCPSRPCDLYPKKFNWCGYNHSNYKPVYKKAQRKDGGE